MNPTNPYDTIQQLREQVAAQAAVIDKLREALNNHHEIGLGRGRDKSHSLTQLIISGYKHGPLCRITKEALATPTNSTQILAEVLRAEREKCICVINAQKNPITTSYANGLVFDPANNMVDKCAAAIRAMENRNDRS